MCATRSFPFQSNWISPSGRNQKSGPDATHVARSQKNWEIAIFAVNSPAPRIWITNDITQSAVVNVVIRKRVETPALKSA